VNGPYRAGAIWGPKPRPSAWAGRTSPTGSLRGESLLLGNAPPDSTAVLPCLCQRPRGPSPGLWQPSPRGRGIRWELVCWGAPMEYSRPSIWAGRTTPTGSLRGDSLLLGIAPPDSTAVLPCLCRRPRGPSPGLWQPSPRGRGFLLGSRCVGRNTPGNRS